MPNKVLVWDLPLRLFHWLLVAAILWAWVAIEILEDLQLHFYAGYSVLTLLLFRILWGFCGTYYARLSRLLQVQSGLPGYLRSVPHRSNYPVYAGHNPLASLAIILMLCTLLFQTGSGLFAGDDYLFGPLAGLVEQSDIDSATQWHHRSFELLQILIAVHLLAIVYYRFFKRQALTQAMLTGYKELPAQTPDQSEPVRAASKLLALILFLVSVAAVYLLVNHVADPVPLSADFF